MQIEERNKDFNDLIKYYIIKYFLIIYILTMKFKLEFLTKETKIQILH